MARSLQLFRPVARLPHGTDSLNPWWQPHMENLVGGEIAMRAGRMVEDLLTSCRFLKPPDAI
ncbi:hypothetical protein LAB1_34210 [Roseibium sp. LAB1]